MILGNEWDVRSVCLHIMIGSLMIDDLRAWRDLSFLGAVRWDRFLYLMNDSPRFCFANANDASISHFNLIFAVHDARLHFLVKSLSSVPL